MRGLVSLDQWAPGTNLNDNLLKRGLRLEYLTLGWNVVGTAVVMVAAVIAGSVALAGFGIDSLIEILASVVVVWQLNGAGQDRERRAMRIIAIAFFVLVIYVLIQSSRTLLLEVHPETSVFGIVWLAATLVAMLLLSWGKHQTGRQLNNPVLLAEARVTLVDAYLAAAVLAGLILNSLFGWWWADPLAGLVIVYYGLREGLHAWHEATT
jgi:divalent metal cation (Fe/Co/Zn/Cd) transporter